MKRSLSILLTVALLLTNCFALTTIVSADGEVCEVNATGFISNGAQVYTLAAGDISGIANIKNGNAVDVTATVFLYLYNASGILEDVKFTSETIAANSEQDVTTSAITVTDTEGYSLNVIAVVDAENIMPLGAVKTITTATERGNFKDIFDIPMYTASTQVYLGKWTASKHKAVQRSNGENQAHYIEGSGDGNANVLTSLTYEGDFGGKALAFEVTMNDSKEFTSKEFLDGFAPVMQVTTDGTSWTNVYPEYMDYTNVFNYIGWNGYFGRIAKFVVPELPADVTGVKVGFTGNYKKKILSVEIADEISTSGMYSVDEIESGIILFDDFSSITADSGVGAHLATGSKFTRSGDTGWGWIYKKGTFKTDNGSYSQYFEGWGNNWHPQGYFAYDGSFGGNKLEIVTGMILSHEVDGLAEGHQTTDLASYVENYALQVLAGETDVTADLTAEIIDTYTTDDYGPGYIVKYTLAEIPEGTTRITLKPTGNWHHKLFSVGVYDPVVSAQGTDFVDTFATVIGNGPYNKVTSTDVKYLSSVTEFYCQTTGTLQGPADYNTDASLIYEGKFGGGTLNVDVGVVEGHFKDTVVPATGNDWDGEWGESAAKEVFEWLPDNFEIYAGSSAASLSKLSYEYVKSASGEGVIAARVAATIPAGAKVIKIVYKNARWQHKLLEVSVSGAQGESGSTPEPTEEPSTEPTATPEPTAEPTATPEPTADPTIGTNFVDTFDTVPVTDAYTQITATDVDAFYSASSLYCVNAGRLQGPPDWDGDGTLVYNGEFSGATLNVSLGCYDWYYRDTAVGNTDYDPQQLYNSHIQPKLSIYAGGTETAMRKVSYEYAGSANTEGQVAAKVSATLPEGTKFIKIVYAGIRWQSQIYEVSVTDAKVNTLTTLFDNFSTIDGEAQGTNFLTTDTVGAQYSYVSNLVYRTDRDAIPADYQGENPGIIEGSWGSPGGFGIGYSGNFNGRAMRISLAYNENTYKEAFYAIRGDGVELAWNDYEALYKYYIKDNFHFNYGTSHDALVGDAGIYKYTGQSVQGYVIINVYSNKFPESSYVEAKYDYQSGKNAFYWQQRLVSVAIDDVYAINGTSYIDPDATFEEIFNNYDASNYTDNMVSVISPAYTSEIEGETTVVLCAPNLDNVKVYNWKDDTNVLLADLTPNGLGFAGFKFDAANLEYGPNNIKLYGYKDGTLEDICELIVYNTTSTASKSSVGLENAVALPAEVQALNLTEQYSDDFEQSSLSFSSPYNGASGYDYYGPIASRLFSDWGAAPFTNDGKPFSMTGDYLRIRATVDADGVQNNTTGSTGFLASLNETTRKGFAIKAPAYFECKFIAQNTQGSWPSFWLLNTQNGAAANHGIELDVIEAYGSQPSDGKYTVESTTYSATSHDWGSATENDHPAEHAWVNMLNTANGSTWHQAEHAYGVLVTETETIYYLDGVEVLRHNNFEGSDEYLWFMIDYAFGSGWTCDATRYNDLSDMYVDWVRVYGLSENVMPN